MVNTKSLAVLVLFSIVLVLFGQVKAQPILEICHRQCLARVLTNNCVDDWETQIQTSDTTGTFDYSLLAGLSGIALTSQESNLEITDTSIVATGSAMASSEYIGECFPPPINAERHLCISEYKIIFRIINDATYTFSCDLSEAGGSNKFLLTEYPSGPILVNKYGNVGAIGSGPLMAGKTYQLYVDADVNVCWYCSHFNAATFDFDFTVVLEDAPVNTESYTWSAIIVLYR